MQSLYFGPASVRRGLNSDRVSQMVEVPIPFSPRFSEALRGAADLHARQTRKGTQVPYIAHLLAVASIALEHGAHEDEAIAALLHDAIEDAPVELGADWVRKWLRFRFGEGVLSIVEGCTDADVSPKPPWRTRKEAHIARVPKEPASVVLVSAADKLHNAGAILRDYGILREHGKDGDRLWKRFNADAGKAGTIGYYRGLVTAYKTTGHHKRLVGELDTVVAQIEYDTGHPGVWPLP
jgi:(p)ppGpp synthase/HD superfamily hydrolase